MGLRGDPRPGAQRGDEELEQRPTAWLRVLWCGLQGRDEGEGDFFFESGRVSGPGGDRYPWGGEVVCFFLVYQGRESVGWGHQFAGEKSGWGFIRSGDRYQWLGDEIRSGDRYGCGCQNRFGIPCWLVGEFTTHFRLDFGGDWDAHWGYGLLTHGHINGLRNPAICVPTNPFVVVSLYLCVSCVSMCIHVDPPGTFDASKGESGTASHAGRMAAKWPSR